MGPRDSTILVVLHSLVVDGSNSIAVLRAYHAFFMQTDIARIFFTPIMHIEIIRLKNHKTYQHQNLVLQRNMKNADQAPLLLNTPTLLALWITLPPMRPFKGSRSLCRLCGHCPSVVVSYTTLIHGDCEIGDMDAAQKVLDEMSERGVRPNAFAYCALLGVVLRKREFEKANVLIGKIWEVMESTFDVKINNAAFSNVIDYLCREGLFHEVFNIAEHMPQVKNVHQEFSYGQMIDSLCRSERYNGATRIVYIMRKRGFSPSSVSYNSILHGLCKDGDFLRAFQLLEEGICLGYSPSEFTYAILVEGLCQQCEVDKANQVLNVMLSKKHVDGTRIYNIYLRALCRMKNPSELLNVLVLMLQSNCPPDIISLNTLIKGFCMMGKMEEALQVLNDMINGKFCAPDKVTFTTIIQGLLNVGKAEEAMRFLHHVMPEKGFSPGVVTYNAVLRGLVKLGQAREAMELFNNMICRGVAADCLTHTVIIEGLCESNSIDDAVKFWSNVVWPSAVHDSFVYSALLKGLCRSERFSEACHLLYEMADCGVALNNVNYNIVIGCACKLGLKKGTYQIVGEMRKNGLRPDSVTARKWGKTYNNSSNFCNKCGFWIRTTSC
ncbi:hypothetical protein SASPL_104624 [Salvia splendens]|uniref:Leucine-rich PPR motif-containing protein, mitochondrial n=1 Tax=Salvia splendens TaxID=180675 RepID=A0A8X8YHJ2_SALSN|nr:hypothetical protein SASPL_104624 [Salvia splendens]